MKEVRQAICGVVPIGSLLVVKRAHRERDSVFLEGEYYLVSADIPVKEMTEQEAIELYTQTLRRKYGLGDDINRIVPSDSAMGSLGLLRESIAKVRILS